MSDRGTLARVRSSDLGPMLGGRCTDDRLTPSNGFDTQSCPEGQQVEHVLQKPVPMAAEANHQDHGGELVAVERLGPDCQITHKPTYNSCKVKHFDHIESSYANTTSSDEPTYGIHGAAAHQIAIMSGLSSLSSHSPSLDRLSSGTPIDAPGAVTSTDRPRASKRPRTFSIFDKTAATMGDHRHLASLLNPSIRRRATSASSSMPSHLMETLSSEHVNGPSFRDEDRAAGLSAGTTRERWCSAVPDVPIPQDFPGSDLLRAVTEHAGQHYREQDLMTSLAPLGKSRQPVKVLRDREIWMTNALDGSALIALGMLAQELAAYKAAEIVGSPYEQYSERRSSRR
ncbi:uncharacterized protein L969DRAFT_68364 [Mixia osmundae IAM 14324]|uniref:Uncharacterized protein n=1 Tax=Mixia osmundae (strain CBS 9802 / IAM 14324 / JCM 22182 / KY 12970) TaxID=764103 RepID=G7E4L7_MIXOS|nr:uncharacterized protein L969DRAFT_68364 [Mixia osmundae IAM 14324]KEI41843.1 hypothetical protein L969DRAFT_68364 [Mixia osmundae IAM 14324]GAA97777.1 hypothetical protein E5Q_04456 [Mixia osmundae IAM 14324]